MPRVSLEADTRRCVVVRDDGIIPGLCRRLDPIAPSGSNNWIVVSMFREKFSIYTRFSNIAGLLSLTMKHTRHRTCNALINTTPQKSASFFNI
jgi:hypothetical protein